MFYTFYLWEHTESLVLKIFEIESTIEIKWYLPNLQDPLRRGKRMLLHVPIHVSKSQT